MENATKKTTDKKIKGSGAYTEAVGRRKSSIARVRLREGGREEITVNGRDFKAYFPTHELQTITKEAFSRGRAGKFSMSVLVKGGGVRGQAEAIRLGVARALLALDEESRTKLKKAGFLKRDPRVKERKKFGLKKARRAPQWSKR
ncbi:30S ribosomal protein S9 [bacterium]|nr:30S ribosomal protein S9 [bacterium]MCI0565713.1 30S ribosomal protein S9 [bacterium]MCI0679980.1 30S ribosomal protein S9 [bacterium]